MASIDDDDIRLLRAAPSLLEDLQLSLRKLLWKTAPDGHQKPHRRARVAEVWRIFGLIQPFQEDPQLLDTHLRSFLPDLVACFLANLDNYAQPNHPSKVMHMPKAICQILNLFCKARGHKIIVGFLNNEPKYLEPILSCFERRHYDEGLSEAFEWDERYMMLLWLSHLMLAPFDLATISSPGPILQRRDVPPTLSLPPQAPEMVSRAIHLCVDHLDRAGKERDAAALLLVRLCIRPDMQKIGLPDAIVAWILGYLKDRPSSDTDIHFELGLLSFLNGFVASAGSAEMTTLMPSIRRTMRAVIIEGSSSSLWVSAVSRKLAIKILRNIVLHSLNHESDMSEDTSLLEDAVEFFLDSLADKDTPVRYAASKALSMMTMKLDPSMGTEVIEAVLGCLNENVLWQQSSRDLSAVDPLRWHGLTLTLAHLLYRRAPPVDLIPEILNALILALNFEQRSTTGGSIGTNVRDAACFGIWSLSRRYATSDLRKVETKDIRAAEGFDTSLSILQILALELLAAACLDPGGNIRRGSSAALQELVGRHPDTISHGIALVQTVDFHAVGLRDRAMRDVSMAASRLDPIYWRTLFAGLLGWRGVGSPDAASRLSAASAIGMLSRLRRPDDYHELFETICSSFSLLSKRQVEERHGLTMALAQFLSTCEEYGFSDQASIQRTMELCTGKALWSVMPMKLPVEAFTAFQLRPEYTASAVAALVSSLSKLSIKIKLTKGVDQMHHVVSQPELSEAMRYMDLVLRRSEESVLREIPDAIHHFTLLLDGESREVLLAHWLRSLDREVIPKVLSLAEGNITFDSPIHSAGNASFRGTVIAIGSAYRNVESDDLRASIVQKLNSFISGNEEIDMKVTTLRSLKLVANSLSTLEPSSRRMIEPAIWDSIGTGLEDYTITERGDVGSLVRLESIGAVEHLWQAGIGCSAESQESVVAHLLRLASEKIDKVRLRAAKCLDLGVSKHNLPISLQSTETASSYEYFYSLLASLPGADGMSIRRELIKGYMSSAALGSSSVVTVARLALADFSKTLPTFGARSLDTYSLHSLADGILNIFRDNLATERIIIPVLDTVAFLLDSRILHRLSETPADSPPFKWKTLLSLVQKSHFKSTNISKLIVAIECYRGLAEIDATRHDATAKLISMLTHPFPKVRIATAESMLVLTTNEDLRGHDWTLPTKMLKPVAERIRGSCL